MNTFEIHLQSDSELLKQLKDRNKLAFEIIYNRYWSRLYVHACKMLHNEDDAKDVIQELFLTLYTKDLYLEKTSLSAYLYSAVRNKILNIIEHNQVKNNYETSFIEYYAEFQNSTTEKIFADELSVVIDKEIQQLPAKMRNIFEMSRLDNLSHKEIADKLNISDKTVKKQISNSIKILRFRLAYLQIMLGIVFKIIF